MVLVLIGGKSVDASPLLLPSNLSPPPVFGAHTAAVGIKTPSMLRLFSPFVSVRWRRETSVGFYHLPSASAGETKWKLWGMLNEK